MGAMDLVEAIYLITAPFPAQEMFGLCAQLRRAAISVPSNIAEGQGRGSPREFRKFLSISRGSLNEVETQIIISARLKYINEDTEKQLLDKCREVARLLNGLIRSLENRE